MTFQPRVLAASPLRAGLLALLAAVALAPAGRAEQADADEPAPSAAEAAKGEIEKLVDARKYQDAIVAVEEMRRASPKRVADAESEFWAARAESRLRLRDAARERFLLVARTYPDEALGAQAAIEAVVVRLLDIKGYEAKDEAEAKVAKECAEELEAAGRKYAATHPDDAARAWYVAGNAWRLTKRRDLSIAAYETGAAMKVGDYPGKCLAMLSVYAAQDLDPAKAQAYLDQCLSNPEQDLDLSRCRKAAQRMAVVGSPAPPFQVETWLTHDPGPVESLRGKVLLVWFFATWCPHCKETMPVFHEMRERLAGKPFEIIGITANTRDQTTESAKAFVADPQWHLTYPVGVDLGSRTTTLYRAIGIPSALLVDKKGTIRWSDHPVYLQESMIEKLLAE